MLIEFSVKNYYSIKDKQTLSMACDAGTRKDRCVLDTGYNAAPTLVECAGIYGPNGSGKSNFINAMSFFRKFVRNSSKNSQADEPIPVEPFKFDSISMKKPSEFEIVFIHEGYLFQYGFTATSKRIVDEWLYATPQKGVRQTSQKWFERDSTNPQTDSFIKKEITGEKKSWKSNTRDNALFLSTAVQHGSKDFKVPYDWIQNNLVIHNTADDHSYIRTTRTCFENPASKEKFLKFMKAFDVSFDDISITEVEFTMGKEFDGIPTFLKEGIRNELAGTKYPEIKSIYSVNGKQYTLDFDSESEGTRRLFGYAGPILHVLDNGLTLVADELHRSLHPLAFKGVLSLFRNPEINKNKAQIIFSSHDTSPMNLLERDQIWLMDKNDNLETILTPLTDFKGRADEAIEHRYMSGRYGALPSISELVNV